MKVDTQTEDTTKGGEYIKALSALEGKPQMHLNNDGEAYVINRAARRKKPSKQRFKLVDYIIVPSNALTKSTNRIKKLRSKNAKRIESRRRAAARARKASQENNTQIA